jgi:putative transposase
MGPTRQKQPRAAVNKVTAGFRVSDELWAVLEPVLPKHPNPHRFGGGKPRIPDRQWADAIFSVLRTGCQWGALDATELCPPSTAHDRFQDWVARGVLLKLWKAGVDRFDDLKGLDGSWLSREGARTKAPLGGEKTRPQSDRPRPMRRQAQAADRSARRPDRLGGSGRQAA